MKPELHVNTLEDGSLCLTFRLSGKFAYGTGERYDAVDRCGRSSKLLTTDHFTCQGAESYLPIPFFMTDAGDGAWIETYAPMSIVIETTDVAVSGTVPELHVTATISGHAGDTPPTVRFYQGTPSQMLSEFVRDTGGAVLPPKWSLGTWISANRWNRQTLVEDQVKLARKAGYPVSVTVIEAWSDESTFHEWNDRRPPHAPVSCRNPWPNPLGMIESLHADGIRLVLWQIPVLKELDHGHVDAAHEAERQEAVRLGLVVKNPDGTPFQIPVGKWFCGSMLPDFTNPATCDWWISKRQKLLDAGVDGFKTDGGEMIYDPETVFHNGSRGLEMRNRYPVLYTQTYARFVGPDRVLFSRAGSAGSQTSPIHWAGDQLSTWDEFRNVIRAGLSAGLSGILFWTFDIAGFTGLPPTADLYRRATQASAYVSCMQWHSDMPSGQYGATSSHANRINDRSPWNIASLTHDKSLLAESVRQANWRMNLMPFAWNEACHCVTEGRPMMRHLVLAYPSDPACCEIEDQFLFGDLLVAPILEANTNERSVYLPADGWMDLWRGEALQGGRRVTGYCSKEEIPVYLRSGSALALNLDASLQFGSSVGNRLDSYDHLCFVLAGANGETTFADDLGHRFTIVWKNSEVFVRPVDGQIPKCFYLLSATPLIGNGLSAVNPAIAGTYSAWCWMQA